MNVYTYIWENNTTQKENRVFHVSCLYEKVVQTMKDSMIFMVLV